MEPVYGSFPRIRVRLSGWIFGLILILGLMAALNTGFNLLYIVVSGLFSFVILSGILSFWTLAKISLRRDAPHAVHKSQPFLVSTTLVNHKWLMPAISLRIERSDRKGLSYGYILKLSGKNVARINVRESLDRRGIYPLPHYTVMSSFPFGLFEVRRIFRDNAEIVVYPSVRAVRSSVVEHMPGARYMPRAPTPDGDEYFALREYRIGDDVRHVSWRASARLGKWMIRELAQGSSRDVMIILDTRRIAGLADFDTLFEDAVDMAASLGLTLLKRQYLVGFAAPGVEMELGEGTAQQKRLLMLLAGVQATDAINSMDFEQMVHNLEHLHATLLLISPDPRQWGARQRLGNLRALDPREVVHA